MRDIVLAPSIRVHRADRSLAALVSKMLACADQTAISLARTRAEQNHAPPSPKMISGHQATTSQMMQRK